MINNKHPQGYLPKIAYHIFKGNDEKVNYFIQRQEAQYGQMSVKDMGFIGDTIRNLCLEYGVIDAKKHIAPWLQRNA
jgi:hypothetical protein